MDDGSICNAIDELIAEIEANNRQIKSIRRELGRQTSILGKILDALKQSKEEQP
ncbi:MAG: hypothetical protein AB7F21_07535 [Desulfuromonadales bacterium]